ncbi:MAG: hypothetical protein JSV91_03660 [Phycisphaerales bacterium]|nr:MAG: hypothetical protein JSV91_03660 [Phycisphaerales bacterium]
MRSTIILILGVSLLVWLLGMQEADQPPLPQGHPPVAMPEEPAPPSEADPADVASIEAIVTAYYDVISGDAGQTRNWDRFRSLFAKDARFITVKSMGAKASPVSLAPEQYVELNRKYFERGGYHEREIHQRVDSYGKVAHVFSTYESRRKGDAPDPYSRGINSIQLISNGQRWWIASIMWDYERGDENPIPEDYLPDS